MTDSILNRRPTIWSCVLTGLGSAFQLPHRKRRWAPSGTQVESQVPLLLFGRTYRSNGLSLPNMRGKDTHVLPSGPLDCVSALPMPPRRVKSPLLKCHS